MATQDQIETAIEIILIQILKIDTNSMAVQEILQTAEFETNRILDYDTTLTIDHVTIIIIIDPMITLEMETATIKID